MFLGLHHFIHKSIFHLRLPRYIICKLSLSHFGFTRRAGACWASTHLFWGISDSRQGYSSTLHLTSRALSREKVSTSSSVPQPTGGNSAYQNMFYILYLSSQYLHFLLSRVLAVKGGTVPTIIWAGSAPSLSIAFVGVLKLPSFVSTRFSTTSTILTQACHGPAAVNVSWKILLPLAEPVYRLALTHVGLSNFR